MCITWPRVCLSIHLLWCISYTVIGTIQVVVGVVFFALSFLKLCSNIWIGILNIIFGIGGAVYAMVGTWSLGKQRAFLYMAISVLIANVINLVLLEVGEWHILLPESAKKLIEQGNVKMLLLYARTVASLSTLVAALIAFVDSQITFCSMQYHERYHKKVSQKQDVLSDTEYVLPRVKSDSEENENATYFNKQYGQSWVYKTSTAESSTVNSVPNRYSGTSSDNLIDSKQTPASDVEFKDISTQNLNIEQPVVVVENTSDYTDRQLHYMASFSRTPSPVPASDSSSENSCSINGPQLQERLKKVATQSSSTSTSNYRSRLDSAKSTGAIVGERHTSGISPRPPSISGGEQLRHDSLTPDLQETMSQRSFKISADQIFIPLKDETVIRINDEVFVTPNKPRRSSPQPETFTSSTKGPESSSISSPSEAKTVSFSAVTSKLVEKAFAPTGEKVKSALPEVIDVIRKELIQKKSYNQPQPPPTMSQTEEIVLSEHSSCIPITPSKVEPFTPYPTPQLQVIETLPAEEVSSKPLTATSPTDEQPITPQSPEQSLEEAMQQYLYSPAAQVVTKPSPIATEPLPLVTELSPPPSILSEDKLELSPSPKDPNVPSPTLERQTKIERDDTVELENEPYMFSRSQFDRQDTVILAKLPTPTSERQTFIERQDAIMSPREDKSYELPPPQDRLSSFPSPVETEAHSSGEIEDVLQASSEDLESNNSNNASTDKESIIDFKVSDDNLEITTAQDAEEKESSDICDTPGKASESELDGTAAGHLLGNEIDNIFKIAEDPRLDEGGDCEDAELFNLNLGSDEIDVENIPPPELDASTFANIPPPEETEDINGVDPEEWEESDEDSMNGSCVQRVPPPSTPND